MESNDKRDLFLIFSFCLVVAAIILIAGFFVLKGIDLLDANVKENLNI
jgi:hypothetical protein